MIRDIELQQKTSSPVNIFVPLAPEQQKRLLANVSRRLVLLIGVDAAILVGSIELAQRHLPIFRTSLALCLMSWMAVLWLLGFYSFKHRLPFYERAYELVKVFSVSLLLISATSYLFPSIAVSRAELWGGSLIALAGLLSWRTVYHAILPLPAVRKRVLIVGGGERGEHIAEEVRKHPTLGYEVVAFVGSGEAAQNLGNARTVNLSGWRHLATVSDELDIDSIVLAMEGLLPEDVMMAVGDCVEAGYEILNVAQLYERLCGRVPVRYINHSWFIHELNEANRGLYVLAKRMLDVGISLAGLLATGVLLPFLAILIKLDSPGPIFYSQERVGKQGKPFRIYKFRTMRTDAEANGAVWARVNDNRVTRLGNFLRRTRLDELPQFLNVLRGEMSLVGPRPERPEFVHQLAGQIPFFNRRHMVLPGLTGWAQVNYPYGASIEDSYEKLQFDLYYIKNRSVFLDLEIMLRTISVVMRKTGSR